MLALATACGSMSQSPNDKAPVAVEKEGLMQVVRQAGKPYVLVNFFVTACKPCEQEIPELLELSEDPQSEAAVMFVTLDGSENLIQDLDRMFDRMNVSFPSYQYTLDAAQPFIEDIHPQWRGDVPLNLLYRQDGSLVKALGMTTPEEVVMEIHRDQSLRVN